MIDNLIKGFVIYSCFINIFAVIITTVDKIKAKQNMWRISEKFLFTVAFFGGAIGEYITMLLIRHKTKHIRFMVGLPLIILLQIAVFSYIVFKVAN